VRYLLTQTPYFRGATPPDQTEAVAIRCVADGTDPYYRDGAMLGTYRHHAGHFTINSLNLLDNLGNPAADRLLFNLVAEASSDAASLQPLPNDYETEMDSLGITDPG
jgi:hypothetical protein